MMIRMETEEDFAAVHKVNLEAFEGPVEADLVEALRKEGAVLLSLVAELDGEVAGHILFSPVVIESGESRVAAVALGPMAVRPDLQRRGIGSELVKAGLAMCAAEGHGAVFVLGHPGYYPRFGFVPAVNYSIRSEYDVPDEVFMVKELREEALNHLSGTVKYHRAFQDV